MCGCMGVRNWHRRPLRIGTSRDKSKSRIRIPSLLDGTLRKAEKAGKEGIRSESAQPSISVQRLSQIGSCACFKLCVCARSL